MTPPRHERIAELFRRASRLPAQEREAFLHAACADGDERAELDMLLAADAADGSPIDTPPSFRAAALFALESAADLDAAQFSSGRMDGSPLPGNLDRYNIIARIGEGGMGTVFLAEQTHPIRRRVALKIIKIGMDTAAVVARFNAERQALAMMNHPAVARVLDAGSTPEGRPYFVMEHVDGLPITDYCDRHRLTIRERLELFVQVCHGVQHAHQKTIIHRDLKPSNVLVCAQDGRPAPKIIDFGVAKAMTASLTEQSLHTQQGQIIGTPAYMSPEQAAGGDDIDTRTDIYSLGVMLYELLVGALPHERKLLRYSDYAELQRSIRESEPLRPSTRIGRLTDSIPALAECRRMAPAALKRLLRGEPDWITMKALEKDRSRRYASAADFAEDIVRHLRGDAVTAGPPSRVYRLGKLVRRNRGIFAAAAIVLFTLIASLAAVTVQYYEAEQARAEQEQQRRLAESAREAEQRQRHLAEKSERLATLRAGELEQVTQFQSRMLAGISPLATGEALVNDLRERGAAALAKSGADEEEVSHALAEFDRFVSGVNAVNVALRLIDERILDPAAQLILREFEDQPLTRAALRLTLASTYRDFGLNDKALPLFEAALETRQRELGNEHPLTLDVVHNLGMLHVAMGKTDEARRLLSANLDARRRILGEDHRETLNSLNSMGYCLNAMRRPDLAEPYYRAALEGRRRVFGDNDAHTLSSLNNMASLLMDVGRLAEAEPYYREALEGLRRVQGNEHPQTMIAINNFGMLLRSMGRLEEAEPYYQEALELRRRVLGDEHPDTLISLNNMGFLMKAMDRPADAESYYREALKLRRRILGNEHPQTLTSIYNLAGLLYSIGRHADAEAHYREALEASRRTLGERHPDTLDCEAALGTLLRSCGRFAEAEALLSSALSGYRAALAEDHPRTLMTLARLGTLYHETNRLDEAKQAHRQAVEAMQRRMGPEHPMTLDATEGLIDALVLSDELDEAESLARQVASARGRTAGERHSATFRSTIILARVLVLNGKLTEGTALARAAIDRAGDAKKNPALGVLLGSYGAALAKAGELVAAEEALIEAHRLVSDTFGPSHVETARIARFLAELYDALEAADGGQGFAAKAAQWRKSALPPD